MPDVRWVRAPSLWRVECAGSPPAWFLSERVAADYARHHGGVVVLDRTLT